MVKKSTHPHNIEGWLKKRKIKDTSQIKIPKRLVDQVIGQDEAVEVIKKAAKQRRHVMLIGDPGTGKSMLARSMTELLPKGELEDVIAYHNPEDPNNPKIRVVPAGKGKEIVKAQKANAMMQKEMRSRMKLMICVMVIVVAVMAWILYPEHPEILFFGIIAAAILYFIMRAASIKEEKEIVPKLLISHKPTDMPPFIDATGAHAGALLGDVKHDPFQSGGLETPAHERVEVGAIHKAHKGVLFIDEINILRLESQQSLLTGLQEHEFAIMGQSERSSGAMVKSEPVPCDFILVAAGNLDSVEGMHPALRSRIRGYGYEVYVNTTMKDSDSNLWKLVRFVAQEVAKDKKIPHFHRGAIGEVIREAQRRSGRQGQISLRFRELGGLIRAAGDIANEKDSKMVMAKHVLLGRKIARSLEQQVADRFIEKKKEYDIYQTEGAEIGRVNGLAVMGAETGITEYSGVLIQIVADVTPAASRAEGKIIATGKLGEIAKEAVQNVSALIKKHTGEDISNHDVHIQFIGTYEGVEGDSASISVATAVISALEGIEVDQNTAMTGSLSIRGEVLPVGGVTAKIEAAVEAGIKRVIIPAQNLRDVLIDTKYRKKVQIIPAETIQDVLNEVLISGPKKDNLINKLKMIVSRRNLKKLIIPISKQKEKIDKKSRLPADPSFSIDNPQPSTD
ncbi:ATP-dependent protease LonB [[Eubacterium] cellulosolvens]